MKKFLLFCLVVHVVVEGVVALLLIASPRTLQPEASMSELFLLITQGFVTITMVSVVAWFWPHRHNIAAMSICLGILATFHTAIGLAALYTATMGNDPSPYALHGVLAVCFWVLWFRRQQLIEI